MFKQENDVIKTNSVAYLVYKDKERDEKKVA